MEPLRKLTRGKEKRSWEAKQIRAFEALKEALSCEPVLAFFRLNAPTYVITDASPAGLGAILLQGQNKGDCKTIAYISRSLSPTERRYSQIEREALRCVWAVINYLFGRNYTVLTDNEALSSMLDPQSSKVLPPGIQRLAWRLHQWNFQIEYITGKANTADLLSRIPSESNNSSDSGIVCESYVKFVYDTNVLACEAVIPSDMSRETRRDDTLSKLVVQFQSGKGSRDEKFKPFSAIRQELSVYKGVLLRGNRIFVPPSLK